MITFLGRRKKIKIFLMLTVLIITLWIYNKKIEYFLSLTYLYITSPREVLYESLVIEFPYDYLPSKDEHSLYLYSMKSKNAIFFKKKLDMNDTIFQDEYLMRIEKMGFRLTKKESKKINGANVYLISAEKNHNFTLYAFVQHLNILVEYTGFVKNEHEFEEILGNIKETNRERTGSGLE